jgi:hypothetical protein
MLHAQERNRDSVSITIHLNNSANEKAQIDSVFIVFDRFDLSGAGLIKKIYRPENNTIVLDKLPKGKYYLEVFCLGNYKGHFEKTMMVHPKASGSVSFKLEKQDFFETGLAFIPPEKLDFSKLPITRRK